MNEAEDMKYIKKNQGSKSGNQNHGSKQKMSNFTWLNSTLLKRSNYCPIVVEYNNEILLLLSDYCHREEEDKT